MKKSTDLAKKRKMKTGRSKKVASKMKAEKTGKTNMTFEKEADTNVKSTLDNLKETDAELYSFLKENDPELLNFNISDSSDDEDDAEGEVHSLPDALEVASDDSDAEEDSKPSKGGLSVAQIRAWEEDLDSSKVDSCTTTLSEVMRAFQGALEHISATPERDGKKDKKGKRPPKYKVQGVAVYNNIIRLCVQKVAPALKKILKAPSDQKEKFDPRQSKKWNKIRITLRCYLNNVVELMSTVTQPAVVIILLKHTFSLTQYYSSFTKPLKLLIKRAIYLWSTSSDKTISVLSFMIIHRLVQVQQSLLLQPVVKKMYLAYVSNCKFTSPSTWPLINFMTNSLVELFMMDRALAYQNAFVYIRQLAINLRNAITVKKESSVKTVHNWQFIHSLRMWARLLGKTHPCPVLEPLIYPLTQVITGTLKLVPASKFYPLHLQCIKILIELSREAEVFIPILPFIMEILCKYNFNAKHATVSMKPMDFSCMLRASKSQLAENGFKDALFNSLYNSLVEYLHDQQNQIAFPELVLPTVVQLRAFVKAVKIAAYGQKSKELLTKLNETVKCVESRRQSASFALQDSKAVKEWEVRQRLEKVPLDSLYNMWKKVQDQERVSRITNRQEFDNYDLPTIAPNVGKNKQPEEFKGLFPSDDEDDLDTISFFPEASEDTKKRKADGKEDRKIKQVKLDPPVTESSDEDEQADDIVEEMNASDLDKSFSESEPEEEESSESGMEDESDSN